MLVRMIVKVDQPLSHRIGRALVPVGAFPCLLGRHDFDKSAGDKIVEPVTLLHMPV